MLVTGRLLCGSAGVLAPVHTRPGGCGCAVQEVILACPVACSSALPSSVPLDVLGRYVENTCLCVPSCILLACNKHTLTDRGCI